MVTLDYQQNIILKRVENAVVADANSEPGSALKSLGAAWPRSLTEQSDRAADSVAVLMIYVLQLANFSGAQFDPKRHTQSRSDLTCDHGIFGPSSAIRAILRVKLGMQSKTRQLIDSH